MRSLRVLMSFSTQMCVAGLLTLTPLTGQRTWVVDPEGRPGADFIDLPPAVLASAAGDEIQVRGSASERISLQTTITKPLTIVGEGDAHYFGGTLSIMNIPLGQRVVIRDLGGLVGGATFPGLWMSGTILISNCAGSVHLQDLHCSPNQGAPYYHQSTYRIAVSSCSDVTLRGCQTAGPNGGLRVTSSTLLAMGCTFFGSESTCIVFRCSGSIYPAASIAASTVVAVDTQFYGGSGWFDYLCSTGEQNQVGIYLSSSQLTLIGPTSAVRGGDGRDSSVCWWGLRPAPCVFGTGSVVADPAAILHPPPQGVDLTWRLEPVTRSSLAASGGTLTVTVHARPSALAATFVSLPGPVVPTAFGQLWLDPASIAQVDLAILDATGQRSVQFAALTIPGGVPLALQSAIWSGGAVELTVPSVTVVGH